MGCEVLFDVQNPEHRLGDRLAEATALVERFVLDPADVFKVTREGSQISFHYYPRMLGYFYLNEDRTGVVSQVKTFDEVEGLGLYEGDER